MPFCINCRQYKPEKRFNVTNKGYLHLQCMECDGMHLIHCAFCGGRIPDITQACKVSNRLYECRRCHQNTLAIIEKNRILQVTWKLNQLISKTKRMPNNLIGNLRDQLFGTIEDLRSGKVTPDVASSINDVAKTIIDSARVENEFIKLTESAGSGFIPLQANSLKDVKQIGQ